MFTIRITNIVIFIGVYTTINIKDVNAIPPASSFSFAKGSTRENFSNIHSTGESTITSSNFKNMIRNEITSILRDCSMSIELNMDTSSQTVEDLEDERSVKPRSIKCDSENKNVVSKLDDIFQKFKSIENMLKDFQIENKKNSDSIEQKIIKLKEEESLGVHCKSCTKTLKHQTRYPKNCKEVQRNGNHVTGIYEIYPTHSKEPFPVLCDMDIRGGGWTVFQKRFDGSQDFFLEWRDYKFGFGNLEGEFWLGLAKIYLLTGFTSMELLVEIVDRNNVSAYAHYSSFGIGSEPGGYQLERLSGYSGDAGDSLAYHHGQKFSTKDLDFSGCANRFFGAWWYNDCARSNLNGKRINIDLPTKYRYEGLHWDSFKNAEYSHAKSRMLVRPIN